MAFKFQWPRIPSLTSVQQAEILEQCMIKNCTVGISEKLDGCNICVSSNDWIASRRTILVKEASTKNLSTCFFQKQNLVTIKDILPKVKEIKENLLDHFIGNNDYDYSCQVMIYGEWIVEGTSTSTFDRYKYQENGIFPGNMYSFGLGIHFDQEPLKEQTVVIEETMDYLHWDWRQIDASFYLVTLNNSLKAYFQNQHIETVPFWGQIEFRKVFSDANYQKLVTEGKCEGFVISQKNMLFKWTANAAANTAHQNKPDEVSNKIILYELFCSAKSKFSILSDQPDADKNQYIENLVEEILNDKDNPNYFSPIEIKTFVCNHLSQ